MSQIFVPEFADELFKKYLELLEIQKLKPSLIELGKIVKAQATRVPFENISKLFFKKRQNLSHLIDFEQYLEGIEKYNFGGTCYANNFYFNQLLVWLGYDVKLCGADMKEPDVHLVNIVNIEGREFLVDNGYAAPFSIPYPLDLTEDYTFSLGNDTYIIKPRDINNRSKIELHRNGELKHGYNINPLPRRIDEFDRIISDSFKESATFMNALLLTHFENDHFVVVHNMNLIEYYENELLKTPIGSPDKLVSTIEKHFGIPEAIVQESLSGFQMSGDAWN